LTKFRPSAAGSLLSPALALILVAGVGGCARGPEPPNVVLIVMDTTRADRCSFEGYDRPTTPCLDAFAKDAVVFRDAWSPAGWTGPAHASLFTGLNPTHHLFQTGARSFLGDEFPTLAEWLRQGGYATGCFSNNLFVSPEFGLTQGFDHVEPIDARKDRPVPWAAQTHAAALGWAESQARAGRPFFLFVNDMEPHLPYAPPDDVARRFVRGSPTDAELADARAYEFPHSTKFAAGAEALSDRQIALLSDLYDAEIATLDAEIGRLLERLAADGLLDKSIVIVTGDHGELLGQHHMIEHGFSLHRAARQVPLLVRYPGRFDGGRRVDDVVRLHDLPPTVLELCGLPVPTGLDGKSLLGDIGHRSSRAVQGASPAGGERIEGAVPGIDAGPLTVGMQAVYDGRFDYLRYDDGREELYDVTKDPAEAQNLIARDRTDATRLVRLLSLR
jgi:arylsulfatase A-like enzyme